MEAPRPISTVFTGSRRRAASFWQTVARQPSWVIRVALTAFLLIVAVPVAILVGVALLAATVVFALLAVANGLWTRLRGMVGGGDGRENVRIVGSRDAAGPRRHEG
ncbi:MAG: hypothetical protein ACYTJ0_12255 [Planctomycetota bacterium]|jgi:hypothetical protein